jgi:hypothetical protein
MSDSPFSAESVAAGLQRVSDDIKREVGLLIPVAAAQMDSALHARYPLGRKSHPGVPHMREDIRVRTQQSEEALIPISRVSGPRLAYIWQDGTTDRVDSTRKNARRGRMPAAAPGFFERTAVQVRTAMLQRAQNALDRPRELPPVSGGSGGSLL